MLNKISETSGSIAFSSKILMTKEAAENLATNKSTAVKVVKRQLESLKNNKKDDIIYISTRQYLLNFCNELYLDVYRKAGEKLLTGNAVAYFHENKEPVDLENMYKKACKKMQERPMMEWKNIFELLA